MCKHKHIHIHRDRKTASKAVCISILVLKWHTGYSSKQLHFCPTASKQENPTYFFPLFLTYKLISHERGAGNKKAK